jgi:hypothetical protein
MGVTLGGTTTGEMLMRLAASHMIARWGWRAAYVAFSVPVFLIVIPAVLLTVRSRPPGMQRMSVAEAAESLEGFETAAALRTRSLVDDRAGAISVGVCDYRLRHSSDSIFDQ